MHNYVDVVMVVTNQRNKVRWRNKKTM